MTETNLIKSKLKNMTNGRKYVTGIIKEQKLNQHFRNEDLEAILQFHPNNIEKGVSNIDYLVVRIKQPYNDRSLFLKSHSNEAEDSISYVICIQSLFEKFDQKSKNYCILLKHFEMLYTMIIRPLFCMPIREILKAIDTANAVDVSKM